MLNKNEIINSIKKKEASMLEASSIEYIDKISSEHFYVGSISCLYKSGYYRN